MRKILVAATIAASLMMLPTFAGAQERLKDGLLGAGAGALVGGPVGAVAGGATGYIAGPRIGRTINPPRHRHVYYRHGRRHYR